MAMVDPSIRVLLVDDDERLARLIARYLESYGVTVSVVNDGLLGQTEALTGAYDCVVLDLMLPGRDGLDVCRELRTYSDLPIVIVTAHETESERVRGLEAGADDYVVKPFSPRELLARIRSAVRRVRGQSGPTLGTLRVGGLVLDSRQLTAAIDERSIDVTPLEFEILWVLAVHAGHVVSREQLLASTKGSTERAAERSIDLNVCRLRGKLGDDSHSSHLLKTVRGVGYLLADGADPHGAEGVVGDGSGTSMPDTSRGLGSK